MGFTSRAKMVQMGVDDMIWGRLTNSMLVEDGGEIDISNYVHPRVEPEIAYLLKAPLSGPLSTAEAWNAVEAVAPAMEIIDSRYENFKFTVEDVVADNSSSSGFSSRRRSSTKSAVMRRATSSSFGCCQTGRTQSLSLTCKAAG